MAKKKKYRIKKQSLIIILSVLCLIGLAAIIVLYFSEPTVVYAEDFEVELGEKVNTADFIKEVKGGEVISGFADFDTSKIGDFEITYDIRNYFYHHYSKTITVNVGDHSAPELNASEDYYAFVNDKKIDFANKITATDNYDSEIEVIISGDYSNNKAGDYPITFSAKDSSGNETVIVSEVHVLDPNRYEITDDMIAQRFTTSKGFQGITTVFGMTYIIYQNQPILVANKTYSILDSYTAGFGPSATKKTVMIDEAQKAFDKMSIDAAAVNLRFYIVSGYRSYDYQKNIYDAYLKNHSLAATDALKARPGNSEHQTGLAADINATENTFVNTAQYAWIKENCYKYGFILRYPEGKTNETGYQFESWHYRYVGTSTDLAQKLYNNGDWLTLEYFFGLTSEYPN